MNLNEVNQMWRRQHAILFKNQQPRRPLELQPPGMLNKQVFVPTVGRDPLKDQQRREMRLGDRQTYIKKAVEKMAEEGGWGVQKKQKYLAYMFSKENEVEVVNSQCKSWSCGHYGKDAKGGGHAQRGGVSRRAYYHPSLGGWRMCFRCTFLYK